VIDADTLRVSCPGKALGDSSAELYFSSLPGRDEYALDSELSLAAELLQNPAMQDLYGEGEPWRLLYIDETPTLMPSPTNTGYVTGNIFDGIGSLFGGKDDPCDPDGGF
jgi:hypothetical protein